MSRLEGIEVFVAVAEAKSFTAAAQALGVSKSYVSKQIRELEDRLGTRLMNRTTRRLHLTDTGAAYFERCRRVLMSLDEAEQAVGTMQGELQGTLRVSVPMSFGQRYLMPVIERFVREYPRIEMDLELSDRRVDIIEEGFDVVVRIGSLTDSSMIARRLAQTRLVVCASPAYLEQHGAPSHPNDLRDHACLLYHYRESGATWHLQSEGVEVSVKVRGRLRINNGDALLSSACAGLGVALLPDFMAFEALASGRLVRVFPDWCDAESAVWAIYPHGRHLSAKVRGFVDTLADAFETVPWM